MSQQHGNNEESASRSWWASIPATIKALAAMLTALATVITALATAGVLGGDDTPPPAPQPNTAPSFQPETGPVPDTSGQDAGFVPTSAPLPSPTPTSAPSSTPTSAPSEPAAFRDITGDWLESDGDLFLVQQAGQQVTMTQFNINLGQIVWSGARTGDRVQVSFESGFGSASADLVISPDGSTMTGTATDDIFGSAYPVVMTRFQ